MHTELCGEYVLVMEYIDGIPILATDRLRKAGYDLEEIGEKILDNYASQILDHGFFHARPASGQPSRSQRQDRLHRPRHHGSFVAARSRRIRQYHPGGWHGELVRAQGCAIVLAIAKDNSVIDHTRFLADLDLLLNDYGSCDVADIDIGAFLNDILMLTRSCKVTLPSSITSVSRGIVTLEGTIAPFIPNQNVVSIINAHIQRSKNQGDELVQAMQDLALALRSSSHGALDAARYSGETLKMLTRGQLKMNMEVLGSERRCRSWPKIIKPSDPSASS